MAKSTFLLDRDFIELNQLLKLEGLCDSGGMGKAIVASGEVTVDGAVELRKTCKIRAGHEVNGERREILPDGVLILGMNRNGDAAGVCVEAVVRL